MVGINGFSVGRGIEIPARRDKTFTGTRSHCKLQVWIMLKSIEYRKEISTGLTVDGICFGPVKCDDQDGAFSFY